METDGDESRLCAACGWFGDNSETAKAPPPSDVFNPVLASLQALFLYRDVCRQELVAEQVFDAGNATEADLRKIKVEARNCLHSLVQMFTALRRPHQAPPIVLEKGSTGFVPWPDDWTDFHYNARTEPCDTLVGPCACGAWHTEDETWVQEALTRHNAVIK